MESLDFMVLEAPSQCGMLCCVCLCLYLGSLRVCVCVCARRVLTQITVWIGLEVKTRTLHSQYH